MAIAIKSIPILKNSEAEGFQEIVKKNSKKRESIDLMLYKFKFVFYK